MTKINPLSSHLSIPIFSFRVRAGFPSPAEPYVEEALNFNDLLVQNPSATFALRCDSNAMFNVGIAKGDILVVDRSKPLLKNSIVLAIHEDEFIVRRYTKHDALDLLLPENDFEIYDAIVLKHSKTTIIGIITFVLKDLKVNSTCTP